MTIQDHLSDDERYGASFTLSTPVGEVLVARTKSSRRRAVVARDGTVLERGTWATGAFGTRLLAALPETIVGATLTHLIEGRATLVWEVAPGLDLGTPGSWEAGEDDALEAAVSVVARTLCEEIDGQGLQEAVEEAYLTENGRVRGDPSRCWVGTYGASWMAEDHFGAFAPMGGFNLRVLCGPLGLTTASQYRLPEGPHPERGAEKYQSVCLRPRYWASGWEVEALVNANGGRASTRVGGRCPTLAFIADRVTPSPATGLTWAPGLEVAVIEEEGPRTIELDRIPTVLPSRLPFRMRGGYESFAPGVRPEGNWSTPVAIVTVEPHELRERVRKHPETRATLIDRYAEIYERREWLREHGWVPRTDVDTRLLHAAAQVAERSVTPDDFIGWLERILGSHTETASAARVRRSKGLAREMRRIGQGLEQRLDALERRARQEGLELHQLQGLDLVLRVAESTASTLSEVSARDLLRAEQHADR